jgi:iron complex outermembrane receptor protein
MNNLARIVLLSGLSTLALAATPALAQDDGQPAADTAGETSQADVANNDVIVVTGTRTAGRTVADSPVPVDVISSDAIVNSGQTETNKILNQLVPSFNFPQPSIADGSDALRPATLRGLSPDQTLVLVNGKRRHVSALLNINGTVGRGSAAVDMNLIPGLAISRIEVLRDGASSQYGSDAIAGVINIQLKNASHGGRASVTYGQYRTTVDGVDRLTGLQTNGGQHFLDPTDNRVLAGNYSGQPHRHDGETVTFGTNFGLPIGPGGFLNLTAEFRDQNRTNRAGYDVRPNYNRPTAAFDPRETGFDRLQFRFGDPNTDSYNFFLNTGLEVGGGWEIYGFGSYGVRDSLSAANYRQQNAAANRDYGTIAPGTTPNAVNFVPLTPDGFLPLIDTELKDYSGTVGLRGDIGGWKADLSVGYGHDSFDYTVRHTLNTSFGTASQSTFDAGGLRYGQTVANLDLSREYEVGFFKPLTVAGGVEYRNENFQIRPGDFQSFAIGPLFRAQINGTTAANCAAQSGVFNAATNVCTFPGRTAPAGAQGFPGIPTASATDRSRHSYAAYAELDTDPIDGLTTTVAARYEHFSDFGDTFNGKLAMRFEPVQGFALRGSISNGFRAPSLHQQYFTTTSTNFIGGLPVDISTLAVDAPAARALGSSNLKPEKSLNISAGFTANPFRGLTVTVDAYRIKIDDRIVLTENLGAAGSGTAAVNAAVKAVLDANGFQSVGAARFFINGLDTTTKGVDAVANYRLPNFGLGSWTLTAAYNYNKNKIDKRINTLGPLASIPNIILFGRIEGLRFEKGQPKDKVVLTVDGNVGDFGITARTTRFGRVLSPGASAPAGDPLSLTLLGPDDIILSPKWLTDLELRYKAFDRVELAIGADNVFDVYPDRSPFGNRPAAVGGQYPANQYYIPYSIFSPFGFNGRFIYGRVSISF